MLLLGQKFFQFSHSHCGSVMRPRVLQKYQRINALVKKWAPLNSRSSIRIMSGAHFSAHFSTLGFLIIVYNLSGKRAALNSRKWNFLCAHLATVYRSKNKIFTVQTIFWGKNGSLFLNSIAIIKGGYFFLQSLNTICRILKLKIW